MSRRSCDEVMQEILTAYRPVAVLSEKNHGCVMRLRHKDKQKDLILRRYPSPIPAYDLLCDVISPCLPVIYDVITCCDGQIVLEEYIEGGTVADIMRGGRYRYRGAKRVLTAVCEALSILHERGIVHRDIKPENILVTPAGRVVLIDLNASRCVNTASKDTVVMGTVGYASPEQLGVAQSDARTDLYAMGILLNIMITGEHPSVRLARGYAGRVVEKCTHIHKDGRYDSAEQLARAL